MDASSSIRVALAEHLTRWATLRSALWREGSIPEHEAEAELWLADPAARAWVALAALAWRVQSGLNAT